LSLSQVAAKGYFFKINVCSGEIVGRRRMDIKTYTIPLSADIVEQLKRHTRQVVRRYFFNEL
jgi:hypothetical protein